MHRSCPLTIKFYYYIYIFKNSIKLQDWFLLKKYIYFQNIYILCIYIYFIIYLYISYHLIILYVYLIYIYITYLSLYFYYYYFQKKPVLQLRIFKFLAPTFIYSYLQNTKRSLKLPGGGQNNSTENMTTTALNHAISKRVLKRGKEDVRIKTSKEKKKKKEKQGSSYFS